MDNDLEIYDELRNAYLSIGNDGDRKCFMFFLRYCAERLEDGASVQEIWSEWQEVSA